MVAGVPLTEKNQALKILNDWDSIGEGILNVSWLKDHKPVKYFYMQADWWKWYNEYPEVDNFEKFILEDTENRFLTCLGEDGEHHVDYGDSSMHDIYVMSTLAVEGEIKWQFKKHKGTWKTT